MDFDSMSNNVAQSMTSSYMDPANKQPLRRLEPTIQRFTKIALPTDLERLSQHKKLIRRCREQQDWEKLNTEHINARLTVQQLKANIREMDKARCQIREEDLQALDDRVNPLKRRAMEAIVDFIRECGLESISCDGQGPFRSEHNDRVDAPREETRLSAAVQCGESDEEAEVLGGDEMDHHANKQSLVHGEADALQQRLEDLNHVEESWNRLRGDLVDVHTIIQDFAHQVKEQKEMTDRIEDNVDDAHIGILQGTKNIIKTTKLKSVLLPMGGAIIGTAIGGPIGLMVGYKIGAVAAFGGGAVGYMSGRFFKKKSDISNDSELEKLEREEDLLTTSTEHR